MFRCLEKREHRPFGFISTKNKYQWWKEVGWRDMFSRPDGQYFIRKQISASVIFNTSKKILRDIKFEIMTRKN